MPARLRIWEVDCTLLDAVLALSFDTEELLNCCFSAGVPIAAWAEGGKTVELDITGMT